MVMVAVMSLCCDVPVQPWCCCLCLTSAAWGLCWGSVSLGELGINEVKLWGCVVQVVEMDCRPFGWAGCYFLYFPDQRYLD